jgi:hypothetical protein
MSYYSASVLTATLSSTTNDIMTIVPASGRIIQLIEFSVTGQGTASSAAQVNLSNITTAGVTGTGGITPLPLNPGYAPAATAVVSTAWGTQPVIGAIPTVPLGVNANGGIFRWVARPDEVILAIGGLAAALGWSIRCSTTGSGLYTVSVTWSENPF